MALTTEEGPRGGVASGEDSPCRGGEGDVFNHDAPLFSTHVLGEPVQLGCLADGEDNMIGPDAHGGVFIEQGRETSLLVDDRMHVFSSMPATCPFS